jgi:hypothetical protein
MSSPCGVGGTDTNQLPKLDNPPSAEDQTSGRPKRDHASRIKVCSAGKTLRHHWLILLILLTGALAFFAGAGAGTRQQHADVLRSQAFVLVDRDGKTRGAFDFSQDGQPQIRLFSSKGVPRATVHLSADGGAYLGVFDQEGEVALSIGIPDERSPGLRIWDAKTTLRVSLSILDDGTPLMQFNDQDGGMRALYGLFPNGKPMFTLLDSRGIPFGLFGYRSSMDNKPMLELKDEKQQPLLSVPAE